MTSLKKKSKKWMFLQVRAIKSGMLRVPQHNCVPNVREEMSILRISLFSGLRRWQIYPTSVVKCRYGADLHAEFIQSYNTFTPSCMLRVFRAILIVPNRAKEGHAALPTIFVQANLVCI